MAGDARLPALRPALVRGHVWPAHAAPVPRLGGDRLPAEGLGPRGLAKRVLEPAPDEGQEVGHHRPLSQSAIMRAMLHRAAPIAVSLAGLPFILDRERVV